MHREGPHYWSTNRTPQQATLVQHKPAADSLTSEAPPAVPQYDRLTRHFYAVQSANGTLKIGGDRICIQSDQNDMRGKVVAEGIRDTIKMAADIIPALKDCMFL